MNKNDDTKNNKNSDNTNAKLDKMRILLSNQDKCKEIAQKLCEYIAKNS